MEHDDDVWRDTRDRDLGIRNVEVDDDDLDLVRSGGRERRQALERDRRDRVLRQTKLSAATPRTPRLPEPEEPTPSSRGVVLVTLIGFLVE